MTKSNLTAAEIAAHEARMGEILSRYEGPGAEVEFVPMGDVVTHEVSRHPAFLFAAPRSEETASLHERGGFGDSVAGLLNCGGQIAELMAATYLDGRRFQDETDRVLARVGDDVDAFYPDSDELEEQGVDIVALAKAMVRGEVTPQRVNSVLGAFRR